MFSSFSQICVGTLLEGHSDPFYGLVYPSSAADVGWIRTQSYLFFIQIIDLNQIEVLFHKPCHATSARGQMTQATKGQILPHSGTISAVQFMLQSFLWFTWIFPSETTFWLSSSILLGLLSFWEHLPFLQINLWKKAILGNPPKMDAFPDQHTARHSLSPLYCFAFLHSTYSPIDYFCNVLLSLFIHFFLQQHVNSMKTGAFLFTTISPSLQNYLTHYSYSINMHC